MESFIHFFKEVILPLTVQATAVIVAVLTIRAKTHSGEKPTESQRTTNHTSSAKPQETTICSQSRSKARIAGIALVGLESCVLLVMSLSDAPLSVGMAAIVGQALVMLSVGFRLLAD